MLTMPHEVSIKKDSDFKIFEKCPRCHMEGRKPVLARYSDGHAYCFWCGYYEAVSTFKQIETKFGGASTSVEHRRVLDKMEIPPSTPVEPSLAQRPWLVKPMPDRLEDVAVSPEALMWLRKYSINAYEVQKNGLMWYEKDKQLIFPYRNPRTRVLLGWQARCFAEADIKMGQKWLTYGPKADIMHVVNFDKIKDNGIIVAVEDIVSAIRVGRHFAAVPVFGSHVGLGLLTRIAVQSQKVCIWLDRDKADESRKTAARASQYIKDVYPIITEKDPKEYSDLEIWTTVRNAITGPNETAQ